jgi:hypothetical protein
MRMSAITTPQKSKQKHSRCDIWCMYQFSNFFSVVFITYQRTNLARITWNFFFRVIRSHGGNNNNNPTAKQLISAYRKNLIHLQQKAHDKGNEGKCIPLQETSILHCKDLSSEQRINFSTPGYRVQGDEFININHTDFEYLQELTIVGIKTHNSVCRRRCYKTIVKTIKFDECISALIDY